MRIIPARWQVTVPGLPRPAALCLPHATALREQHPEVKVIVRLFLDCFRVHRSCDLCAADVPVRRAA